MKRIFTLLIVLLFLFLKGSSQACKVLGCASNAAGFGTQTGNDLQADNTSGILGGCYGGSIPFKQVFWEFFYSPGGGDLVQSFNPSGSNGLDLDWAVWDMGTSAPPLSSMTCPADPNSSIDPSGNGWSQFVCNSESTLDLPTGPGVGPGTGGGPNVVGTTAGHYYAVGIIFSNSGLGPYDFTIGSATLGGVAMDASNCLDIILPVKLSSFSAKVNNCVVNLDWTAVNETDFENYEVESSVDGKSFQTISTIGAHQGTGPVNKYSFQDSHPQQGKIYYRLKMANIDGSFEYSKTIAMRLDCSKSSVFVYPNPVKNILNINVTNSQDNATSASLFDPNGKLVYSGKMISGTNSIDMTKFSNGVYLLKITNRDEVQNIKIIK
jgi:hypothetical protein